MITDGCVLYLGCTEGGRGTVKGKVFMANANASINGACIAKLVVGGVGRGKVAPNCFGTTVDKGRERRSKALVPNSTL